VRNAFNSPFWPFVLASTSVGQEGSYFPLVEPFGSALELAIEPVDFETARRPRQPVSADTRFARTSHRRIANMHSQPRAQGNTVGRTLLMLRFDRPILGELSPWWIYPGDARVERLVVHFPLSREDAQVRTAPGFADALSNDAWPAPAGGHDGVASATRCF